MESHRPAQRRTLADEDAEDLRGVLEAIRTAVVVVDADGVVRYANPAAESLFSLSQPQLEGAGFGLPLAADGHRTEIELRTAAGSVSVEMQVDACIWRGEPSSVVTLGDVTHRVRTEARLRALQERFELAAAATGDTLFDWDLRTGHFHLSDTSDLLGAGGPAGDVDPAEWLDRVHVDDRDGLDHALAEHLYGSDALVDHDHRLLMADGSYRWTKVRARAVFDGDEPVRVSGVLTDIGAQREREDRLLHDSLHDPLTGLANRVLLVDRMHHALQRSVWEPRRRYGVLLVDLDGFKAVNDNYGHAAGDSLLVDLARRMEAAVRPGDTVARIGGDEFAVLVDSFVDPLAVEVLARRLRDALATPVRLGDRDVAISASIGGVVSGQRPKQLDALLERADEAMYRAKSAGGNRIEIVGL